MIARIWRGMTSVEDRDAYLSYLMETGVADYQATASNRGVYVLHRTNGEQAEFLILSLWETREAIHAFAGPDIEQAVYYPDDAAFLLHMMPHVEHYDVSVHPG